MNSAPSSRSEIKKFAALALVHGLAATAATPAKDGADDLVKLPELKVEGEQMRPLSSLKFTEPIRDTPQTLVVVPRLVIEQQGAQTLSDVLRNTPGITFAAGEGGNVASGDSFYMRGFDSSGSIFVDGVRDTGGYSRDVFNLDGVEIAKGPAGADNGRGGSSGYVNLVTKTPQRDPFRNAALSYRSAGRKRATLDLNQPFADGPLAGTALRLNAMWQDSGVPGRNHVENSSWGLSPSLALGLGTPTRLTLAATWLEQDNLPDSGLPIIAVPGGAVLPASVPPLTSPVDQENFYGLAAADFEHIASRGFTLRVEHDFRPDLRLTNQTRLSSNERDALQSYFQNSATTLTTFAATTTPLNPATGAVPPSYTTYVPATDTVTPRRLHTQQDNDIVSNQTNLFAGFRALGAEHALNVGADFSREKQFSPTWQPLGGVATNLHNPDARRAVAVDQIPYQAANNPYTEARIDTAGVYAFDTVHVSDRLQFNASARVERFDTEFTSRVPATTASPAPVAATISAGDTLASWKTGLVFKPRPNGSIYAAYGNSFTPPGSGFALSATATNQNNPNLDPQEARNLEVGTKWDFFDSRLSTSLALYRSENLNVVSTDAVTNQVTQDISQTVEGVEVGISGRITSRWLVFGGFGLIDSENHAAGTTNEATADGAGLRFTPKVSGSLWTTYILPNNLTLGAGVQHSASVVRSTANAITSTSPSLASVPSYTVFNLMADYAVNEHLSLRLNLDNLTDESYFRLNNNGGRYYPGTPRSFLLTANLKF